MKIIMIGSHLRVTGGIVSVIKNYFKAGLDKRVDLEYFPTYYGSTHFINVLYFSMQFVKLFTNLFILKKKYDIAHIHMSYKGSFIRKRCVIKLLLRKRIPVILHMHGGYFKEYFNNSPEKKKNKIIQVLNSVSVIMSLGKEWKEFYESISISRVVIFDNAVFPKNNIEDQNEKYYITTMGLLSQRKGTYDLIEVGKKLKNVIDNKYKFLLAGDGELDKVKQKIKEYNLDNLFIVPGWISDSKRIDEIYRKSIIYVLPSYYEGMPMSILEAMSYGLPIISTNVGSIPTVVGRENGIIISPGNVYKLEGAILSLIKDFSKIRELGINNIKKINENHNIYSSVDNLVLLYRKVINK